MSLAEAGVSQILSLQRLFIWEARMGPLLRNVHHLEMKVGIAASASEVV